MNQSSDGTISPARSSRTRACSACSRRDASRPTMASCGFLGGKREGTKALILSPPAATRSYRPVLRFDIIGGSSGKARSDLVQKDGGVPDRPRWEGNLY